MSQKTSKIQKTTNSIQGELSKVETETGGRLRKKRTDEREKERESKRDLLTQELDQKASERKKVKSKSRQEEYETKKGNQSRDPAFTQRGGKVLVKMLRKKAYLSRNVTFRRNDKR